MTKKERYRHITEWFRLHMPVAETELHYASPFQLLVAVILSAQCTDKRVNMVTPALFEAFPNAESMAQASPETIFQYVRSISYPNNKSKHLAAAARMIVERFNGQVPEEPDDLLQLPGVGRKTANVLQSVIWGKAVMAVDTHVFRVSHRLGLVSASCSTPLSVEKELEKHIAAADIPIAHHWLILHGRYTCTARQPHCADCGLSPYCKRYQTQQPKE